MEPGHESPRDASSVKVRIAASASGIIAGTGAAVASLTHNPATKTGAQRLARRVGKALAAGLGEKPRQKPM